MAIFVKTSNPNTFNTKDYAGYIARHRAFFDGLSNVKQIITYGHSMARVDWPYFEEVIKKVGVHTPWRVSCFSKEDVANTNDFQRHLGLTSVTIIQ